MIPLSADQEFLTDEQVVRRVPGLTTSWLKTAAGQRGKGPKFTIVNRKRIYCWADVCEWVHANKTDQTDRFGERTV